MASDMDERVVGLQVQMARLEDVVRRMEASQEGLRSGQAGLRWGGGLLVAVLLVVVGVDIARIFELGDRLSDVQVVTGRADEKLTATQNDVAEIKSDVKMVQRDVSGLQRDVSAIRLETQQISRAVGAERPPQPNEMEPKPEEQN